MEQQVDSLAAGLRLLYLHQDPKLGVWGGLGFRVWGLGFGV